MKILELDEEMVAIDTASGIRFILRDLVAGSILAGEGCGYVEQKYLPPYEEDDSSTLPKDIQNKSRGFYS